MSAFRMLLAAGYSMKEAVEKVGRLPTKIEMVEIGRMDIDNELNKASRNEEKYSKVGDTYADRIIDRKLMNSGIACRLIEERHLCGVGNCKTNKGVIRRIKYGKGNIGKNGYLKTELKMEK